MLQSNAWLVFLERGLGCKKDRINIGRLHVLPDFCILTTGMK